MTHVYIVYSVCCSFCVSQSSSAGWGQGCAGGRNMLPGQHGKHLALSPVAPVPCTFQAGHCTKKHWPVSCEGSLEHGPQAIRQKRAQTSMLSSFCQCCPYIAYMLGVRRGLHSQVADKWEGLGNNVGTLQLQNSCPPLSLSCILLCSSPPCRLLRWELEGWVLSYGKSSWFLRGHDSSRAGEGLLKVDREAISLRGARCTEGSIRKCKSSQALLRLCHQLDQPRH